jgi:hypothetical protein
MGAVAGLTLHGEPHALMESAMTTAITDAGIELPFTGSPGCPHMP